MAVFEVQGPDGSVYEIEGPETGTAAPETAVSTEPEPTSAIGRATAYITKRGKGFMGALTRLTQPKSLSRPIGETAVDVAEVAGPIVAGPVLTGAGLAAGTVAAAAGMKQPELAEMGVNVAGGLGGAVKGAVKGWRSAKDITAEGERIREMVPGLRQTISGAREKLFDPIIGYLTKTGRTLKAGTPEADKLSRALLDAQEEWGAIAGAGEKRVIGEVLTKLNPKTAAPQPTGVLDASGKMIMHTSPTPVGEISAIDVDDALKVLNKAGKGFAARRALVDALGDLTNGTAAEGRYTAAGKEYFKTIKPAQRLATAVGRQDTPGGAALTLIREWRKMAPRSQQLLDPTGEVAALVKSASKGAKGAAALAGGIGAAGSVAFATQRLVQGDVKGAFGALLAGAPLLALRAPGALGAAARGAAPGLVRGAAGTAGVAVPAISNAPTPKPIFTEPENAPEAPGTTQEPTPVPGPSAAAETPQGPFMREMGAVSRLTGVPVDLLRTVITQESGGRPGVTSHPAPGQAQTPAHGLMQITPGTFKLVQRQVEQLTGRAASLGDPLDNLVAGALLYRKYLEATGGDVAAAARLYHGGENLGAHGPRTQAYGQDISRNYASLTRR